MTNEMKCIIDVHGVQYHFPIEKGYGLIEIGNNLTLVQFERREDLQPLNPRGLRKVINKPEIRLYLENGTLNYKGNKVVFGVVAKGM